MLRYIVGWDNWHTFRAALAGPSEKGLSEQSDTLRQNPELALLCPFHPLSQIRPHSRLSDLIFSPGRRAHLTGDWKNTLNVVFWHAVQGAVATCVLSINTEYSFFTHFLKSCRIISTVLRQSYFKIKITVLKTSLIYWKTAYFISIFQVTSKQIVDIIAGVVVTGSLSAISFIL